MEYSVIPPGFPNVPEIRHHALTHYFIVLIMVLIVAQYTGSVGIQSTEVVVPPLKLAETAQPPSRRCARCPCTYSRVMKHS